MRVAVVGAGIVGVTAALTLAEAGAEVVVLESGTVAGEASGLNAGVVGGGGWGDEPDVDVALKMGSRERFLDLADGRGHDIGLDRTGTLTVVRTERELAWAEATVAAERAVGRLVELLDDGDLRRLEPALDPGLLGAVLDSLAIRAEPVAATEAFAIEARRAGADIRSGWAVTGLAPAAGGGWDLSGGGTGTGVGADVVVLAAGPWCGRLGRLLGVDIPIVPVRGQMWASPAMPPVLRHALAAAESPTDWADPATATTPPFLTEVDHRRLTRHLYGRQRPNGELVFGGDRVLVAEPGGDRTADQDGIDVNHRHVAELLPVVADRPITRTWTGLMPFSLDGRPLIGPLAGFAGLFVAGGLASSGFGRGPMTGGLVADLVLGRDPGIDLTPVLPGGRVRAIG